ncbi:ankyrin repeat domain-containing protein, chloroplastic [Rutidosis leptorrhynchoides]|uniref:ankyrin repeat domain-containing protein, chloroplastic n=1 Tax=Rutidosis leptorrhynchoides TaxID=125765 RepID=UPI003A994503
MSILNHQQTTTLFSPLTTTATFIPSFHKTLNPSLFFRTPTFSSQPLQFSLNNYPQQQQLYTNTNNKNEDFDEEEEEQVIGDCLVFEEGIFEDPFIQDDAQVETPSKSFKKVKVEVKPEDLIPANWKDVQAEINITKKERRKMAQEMEFGSKLQRKKQGLKPIPMGYASAKEYKAAKLRELKPVVLDNPQFLVQENDVDKENDNMITDDTISNEKTMKVSRVAPRNPKMAVYGRSLDDISRFLNSGLYDPDAAKDPQGARKLFTKEEKVLMNRRVPDLAVATSGKWQPLHTLAASGEFYLVDTLMKYNVDINIPNQEGLTAIHKAILSKKHAICNYLLRNSANPFVRDKDGATLMHYAVQTASTQMIKVLVLYNVDINLPDNDGWTPLHLAVQARRTDVVRLLLVKNADTTLKNKDGLTPLDFCLYSGRDTRTYELIKLLKVPPKPRKYAQLME